VLVVARMDPLKYFFKKPTLTGKLSRWLILLAEFDLRYVAKNTIKGRCHNPIVTPGIFSDVGTQNEPVRT
jgi:hypothetical protein